MALTEYQRTLCRLLAAHRIENGESYVAGGSALNAVAGGGRISRDLDLFHDTVAALEATWPVDRALLERNGYTVRPLHERRAYVEAVVCKEAETVLLQWTCDSAYRFFPLVEHDDFGLALHPVDLATNKVLAAVGRLEARDWLDLIVSNDRIQPLGYLVWAACGKDPAFSPLAILDHVARSCRYSAEEIGALSFDGEPPDSAAVSKQWHAILDEARAVIALLPAEQTGTCVLDSAGNPCGYTQGRLEEALKVDGIHFHAGGIRGAWPRIVA